MRLHRLYKYTNLTCDSKQNQDPVFSLLYFRTSRVESNSAIAPPFTQRLWKSVNGNFVLYTHSISVFANRDIAPQIAVNKQQRNIGLRVFIIVIIIVYFEQLMA